MSVFQNSISDSVFPRIMAYTIAKEAWDKLKLVHQGSDRTRKIQNLNLKKDFKSLSTQEDKTIAKYSDRIPLIVNRIRLLGEEFSYQSFVEKVIATLLRRFSKICR